MTEKKSILFIEDEDYILRMYEIKFQLEGLEFFGSSTGVDGIKIARERHPDLILLDVKLEKESGIDILKSLKSDTKTREIPIFLFSNAYQREYEKKGSELGAEKFIVKTKVLPAQMVEIVKKRLGIR